MWGGSAGSTLPIGLGLMVAVALLAAWLSARGRRFGGVSPRTGEGSESRFPLQGPDCSSWPRPDN
jgi:hypothetical protein